MTKRIRLCALLVLAGVIASVPTASQQRVPAEVESQQLTALNRGDIGDAARVNGKFITTATFERDVAQDPVTFGDLRDASDLVFVGRPLSNRSALSANRKTIETVYEVQIETLIKGRTNPGRVTVITPGGRLQFADGSTAQVNTPGFGRPLNRAEYLWFLKGSPNSGQPLALTSGPLGVYAVAKDRIAPIGGLDSAFGQAVNRALPTRQEVLAELSAASK